MDGGLDASWLKNMYESVKISTVANLSVLLLCDRSTIQFMTVKL